MSQPTDSRVRSWSARSTPSATVTSPSERPRRTMVLASTARSSRRSMSSMKLLSILSTSIGRRWRYDSEEYPVPKSSRAIRTPSSLISWTRATASGSAITLSVTSSTRLAGARPELLERVGDVGDDLGDLQLDGRHVHVQGQVLEARQLLPGLRLLARGLQHVPAEGEDLPGLLGDGDERERRHRAALRMGPAHQGLDAVHGAGSDRHRGLVVDADLATDERLPEVGRHLEATFDVLEHLGAEHADAPLASVLGDVERHVRGAEHVGGVVAGVRRRDPSAGVEDDGSPGDLHGTADLVGEALAR